MQQHEETREVGKLPTITDEEALELFEAKCKADKLVSEAIEAYEEAISRLKDIQNLGGAIYQDNPDDFDFTFRLEDAEMAEADAREALKEAKQLFKNVTGMTNVPYDDNCLGLSDEEQAQHDWMEEILERGGCLYYTEATEEKAKSRR